MTFPVIKSVDVDTAIDWYEHFLGFQCTFRNTIKHCQFAVVEKRNLKIYIRKNELDSLAKDLVLIEVDDLEQAYSECDAAGVIFTTGIERSEFGGEQFVLKDYDHNKIIFKNGA